MLPGDASWTYVQARAAAIEGEHARSAELLAALAATEPGNAAVTRKALSEAISAGKMSLAVGLARRLPPSELSVDARLLLVADALKRNRSNEAIGLVADQGGDGNLAFLDPLLRAWNASERRDLTGALAALNRIPANGLAAAFSDETRALILLNHGRTAEAEPFARRAVGGAGPRETRLRLALADAFLKARDPARARIMVDGIHRGAAEAADRVRRGERSGFSIDDSAEAFGEVLLALATDLSRVNRGRVLPLGMAQVARFAAPENNSAKVLLALLLDTMQREDEALALLRLVPESDPLFGQSLDARTQILVNQGRAMDALALASQAANARGATASDWARLGEVFRETRRFGEAANAYQRAIDLAGTEGATDDRWTLMLLKATALEEADRWPEAKQALQNALAIAPDQPLLLNFLGYAKLERGEDLDAAEAMIRKAVELAPDNASITDSLGWALYKRGKLEDAIETLQTAAVRDPNQPEIHEHLGDALYASGRRYEARFAWNAALLAAEADMAARIRAKLVAGLTPATAAP